MKKTPDYKLERYLLGELNEDFTPSEKDLIRIEELKAQNIEFLRINPYNKLESKLNKQSIISKFLISLKNINPKYSLVLSFVFILILSIPIYQNLTSSSQMKGSDINLFFYKKNINSKVVNIKNNSLLKDQDQIQIKYVSGTYKHGLIFSVDGNKNITIHFPSYTSSDSGVFNKSSGFVSNSYVLDNAPSFEDFYLVVSNTKFSNKKVIKSILNNGNLNKNFILKKYHFKKRNY